MNKLGFVNSLSTKMGEEKRFLNTDDMFYDGGVLLPADFVAKRRMFIEYGKKGKFDLGNVNVNFGYFHSDLAKFLEDRIQLVGGASIKYNDIFTFSCRLNESFFEFRDYKILSMVKMYFVDVNFHELVYGLKLLTNRAIKKAFGSFSQFQYDRKDFRVYYFDSPISINKWRIPTQLKIALGGHTVNNKKMFIPLTDLYGLQFYLTSTFDYGVLGDENGGSEVV